MSQSLYARLARKYNPNNFSRRDVLKTSLAASAALLLSNCGTSDPFSGAGGSKRRVIVVGAGFSGLACAYELKAAGYDVLVLEARNRVSGRVLTFTDMVPGKFVEGGGELIGDEDVHSMWWTYANKFKIPMRKIADDDSEAPIIFEGKKLSKDEEKKIFDEMTAAQAPLNQAAKSVNADQPWLSPNADELDAQSMATWLHNVQCSDLTKRAIQAQFEGNEGVAMDRMGYLPFLAMVKGAGIGKDDKGEELFKYWENAETYRCGLGNDALAKKFAALLGNRVKLNSPVIGIVTGNQRVFVTTDDGHQYTAEDVVLTVPPSVWNKIRFTPNLPATLKPQMGIAVKYLAGVKKAYWKDAGLSANGASDGDISMTWEATEGQPGPGALLTCFSGGPAADRARSREPVARNAAYKAQIEQIYPGYAENATTSRFMDWPADPWLMSTYSFGAPRQMKIIGPALAEGMDTLHFAGEHTCWAFPGYMEGGLRSGVMAARKLAKRDGLVMKNA